MIKIRYTRYENIPPSLEVDVSGDGRDLEDLHQRLERFTSSTEETCVYALDTTLDPAPYSHLARQLYLEKTNTKLQAVIKADSISIQARPELLLWLAEQLPRTAQKPDSMDSYHVHIDAISFPDQISESLEFIVTKTF